MAQSRILSLKESTILAYIPKGKERTLQRPNYTLLSLVLPDIHTKLGGKLGESR